MIDKDFWNLLLDKNDGIRIIYLVFFLFLSQCSIAFFGFLWIKKSDDEFKHKIEYEKMEIIYNNPVIIDTYIPPKIIKKKFYKKIKKEDKISEDEIWIWLEEIEYLFDESSDEDP